MQNSKLYTVLTHFDKIEQNRFRKFLASPYFNPNEGILTLFDLVTDHINGESRPTLDKEWIWETIEPGKAYDDVRFRKYCSDLLKLVEHFLAQEIFEENPFQKVSYLIEAISRKKIERLYNSSIRKAKSHPRKEFSRAPHYYFDQYQLERQIFNLLDLEAQAFDKTNVEEISKNLDYFYLSEKLRILNFIQSQKRSAQHEYSLKHNEEILQIIERGDFEDVPAIAIYYQIYLLYSEPENEKHYYKLREYLDLFGEHFPKKDLKEEIYHAAISYCSRKINQGNHTFLKELFQLYKELLEKEIILTNQSLSPLYFRNIVVIALRLGEYEWTENFIHKYKSYLPDKFRDNAVSYNLARLYWYQKNHEKVIELLREVEYEDVTYNLGSKTMLLATYYETDELEPLYSLFESFRVYLNRHKEIPERRKKYYKNLIKYTKKLTKVIPGDDRSLNKLKQEIRSTKGFKDQWLEEKISELE